MTKRRRILYNNDGCSTVFLKAGSYKAAELSEADLRQAVAEVAFPGSQVDSWLICVNLLNFFCSREEGDKAAEPPFEVLRDLGDPKTIQAKAAKTDSKGDSR